MDLLTFLRGLLWSEIANRRRATIRRTRVIGGEIPEEAEDAREQADEALGRRRLLARVEAEVIGDDAELRAVYDALAEGSEKRRDIAKALDWEVGRVKAARVKMNRRLAAAGLSVVEAEAESERGEP
jgi:hypothetical protein